MTRLSALVGLTAAAVAVSATPIVMRDSFVTFPLARRLNLTGAANIVKADQARAKVLKARSQASHVSPVDTATGKMFLDIGVPVTNQAVMYTVNVGVGTPPTNYELIVDTGSSNTWVGAGQRYITTSSSVNTGEEVVSLLQPLLPSFLVGKWLMSALRDDRQCFTALAPFLDRSTLTR